MKRSTAGYSLSEIFIVISIVGIISAIAIGAYGNVTTGSKEAVYQEQVARLNNAVQRYRATYSRLPVPKSTNSNTDELDVLHSLQYEREEKPKDISRYSQFPYFPRDYNPNTSAESSDYRIEWNGSGFQLLKPPVQGSGLRVDTQPGIALRLTDGSFLPVGNTYE